MATYERSVKQQPFKIIQYTEHFLAARGKFILEKIRELKRTESQILQLLTATCCFAPSQQ